MLSRNEKLGLSMMKDMNQTLREDNQGALLALEKNYEFAIRKGDMVKAKILKKRLDTQWDSLTKQNRK